MMPVDLNNTHVLVMDPQDFIMHRRSQLSIIAEDNVNENLMTTQRFNNFNMGS